MSYIRFSTKIPRQKSASNTYAWGDIDKKVHIVGNVINVKGWNNNLAEITLTHQEMKYMCECYLGQECKK